MDASNLMLDSNITVRVGRIKSRYFSTFRLICSNKCILPINFRNKVGFFWRVFIAICIVLFRWKSAKELLNLRISRKIVWPIFSWNISWLVNIPYPKGNIDRRVAMIDLRWDHNWNSANVHFAIGYETFETASCCVNSYKCMIMILLIFCDMRIFELKNPFIKRC